MNLSNEQMKRFFNDEATAMIAASIFSGSWSYSSFLATKPSQEDIKDVNNWLTARLSSPKYQGKIIPGFNDEK